jgi:3-phenylpropionate/trans-cinnamate dioxygenase ferredoxin reductase component
MSRRRVVIVGASLAGATTAVALRRLGFDGEVLLLGDEAHPPYERPALTKGYLAGRLDSDALLVHPAGTYRETDVDVRSGWTATGLDVERQRLLTDRGEVPYDALVAATGSVNIRPPIPGMQRTGVHQLRRIEDADRLAADARSGRHAVVVGMGFIGCEVAATLRDLGLDVTMVDRLAGPLAGVLGPDLSAHVRAWHEDRGVRLVGGAQVAALEGRQTVEGVRLADGRLLPADLVVVGVGVRPATDWLEAAPLQLLRGAVPVDQQGRTAVPQVYAAGDLTAVWDPARGVHRHVEHYRSAIDQATRVAHALVGQPAPRTDPPWFWSEQYDHVLHTAGDLDGRAYVRDNPFAVLVTREDTLTGVATIDNARDFRRALRLLGHRVDPSGLADPRIDLRTLRAEAVAGDRVAGRGVDAGVECGSSTSRA